jgi:hypothetical protein
MHAQGGIQFRQAPGDESTLVCLISAGGAKWMVLVVKQSVRHLHARVTVSVMHARPWMCAQDNDVAVVQPYAPKTTVSTIGRFLQEANSDKR